MPSLTSELIIRLKDELSPAAKKASQALQGIQKAEGDLQKQAEKLAKATESLGNLQKLDKSLATTTAEFGKQRQTLKDFGQQILSTEGPTKKLQESFKRTEQVMEQTRKSMEQQQKAVAAMSRSYQEASGQPFRSFHTAEGQMRKEIERTTAAIGRQAKESQRLIESEERVARRRERIKNAFSGVGMLAGPVILHGADKAYKAGAEIQHRRVEMNKAGMGAMVPALEAQARDLAVEFKNVTQAAVMEMAQEARSVLSKPEEVARVLPALTAAKSVLDARDASGEASGGLGLLVKGAEDLGAGQDPARLVKLIDGYVKAMQVMGKTINPEEVFAFAKNSRLAGASFSDRFLLTTAMSTLQEMGGQTAGKAAGEAVGQLSASGLGKRTGAVKLLAQLGLISEKDVVYNNTGEVSRARKGVLHPVQHDDLLAHNPDKFLYDVLLPAMEKHGITKEDDQIAAIRQIFSGSKGAQDLFGKLLTQRESYAAHASMYPQASGIAGAAQNRDDPTAAMSEVTKSLDTFAGVLTGPMMLPAARMLDDLATGIGKLTTAYAGFAKEHPDLAAVASTIGVAGTAATGLKLTYNLFDKVFGDGGLKGAAAAQLEAGTTLMTAATQLEVAAGRLGAGNVLNTVEGEATKIAGGAGAIASKGLLGRLGSLLGPALIGGSAGFAMGTTPDILTPEQLNGGKPLPALTPAQLADLQKQAQEEAAKPWYQRVFGFGGSSAGPSPSGMIPADAADRMRERNELIDQENQKTKDSVWQFGQLDTSVQALQASFDGLSGTLSALSGGAGGGLINASYGGEGPGASRGLDLSGGTATGEHADFIRKTAARLGIDPRIAVAVSKSEGLNAFVGDRGTSFGDYQLHFASRIPGLRSAGLGDIFNRSHPGTDARDPKNWKAVDEWALRWASKHGWADWHGAARIGVHGFRGIGKGNPDAAMPQRPHTPAPKAVEARNSPRYAPTIHLHVAAGDMDHRKLGDRIAEKLHEHYENFVGASYADTGFA